MKKMFVAIPPKYGMNEKELDAYRKRVEEVAYQAVIKIGEYCTMQSSNDFCLISIIERVTFCSDERSYALMSEEQKPYPLCVFSFSISFTDKRGNPNMTVISEAGLYSLILRSNKPEAKQFKR